MKNKTDASYVIRLTNAGGARVEDYATLSSAREAIRKAASLGRKTMRSVFGENDCNLGEIWTVTVDVRCDEFGETFAVNPCIYVKQVEAR